MKIAIIGAGAMGCLYGGYLSQYNDVYLINRNKEKSDIINKNGIKIKEKDKDIIFYPKSIADTSKLDKMDLVILFVKSHSSMSAIENNKSIIGKETFVMTLQNGAGHEKILMQFVSKEQIIIGTTEHNCSIIESGYINHGGNGNTYLGILTDKKDNLNDIIETFNNSGFPTYLKDNIQELIWNKLFVNISASVLTGVLQVNLGYLVDNENAWFLVERLLDEAIEVSKGLGMSFDKDEVKQRIKGICTNAYDGYTSIYSDIKNKKKTEVDTISGTVVETAKKCGIPAPCNEFIVKMVHAMEGKF